ncbi:MAG: endonuclease MutS2 [Ignavibacteriae bacterium]|nr:endonuclease MutS2 [Ignavibacteriota bacterium]
MREHLNSFSKLELDKVIAHISRYTTSDLGREHVEKLSPLSSLDEIRYQLSLVSEMKRLLEGVGYPPLDSIPDVRIGLHRTSIENFALPADELRKIALLLDTSKKCYTFFSRIKTQFPLLFEQVSKLYLNKILEYNINSAIDESGVVKDSATKELQTIRRQITDKSGGLRNKLESLVKTISAKDWLQEELITSRDGRMVIPIKIEHKNKVPGFIHSSSASGATVFIEPTETLELNNEIRTLQFQELREIEKILKALTEQVRECRDALLFNLEILGLIDFVQAKAKYSLEILGNEPIVKPHGSLKLMNARHPLLFQRHKLKDIVPLNFEISENVRTVIITGPNAGGKSVALKSVGLLCLMVQAGCHVSAFGESEIPIFSDIFVDIGDEQSIENDLSSFSSHLKNLHQIIENANDCSLVLIDEIGSGTDPVEGSALSAAVLERLTNLGCLTIATTHHGSLKVFAYETPHIENAAMEFDQATLQPTYRFRYGVPGSSYAIEMAQRMSLAESLIARAKEFLGNKSYNLEQLIAELERHSQQLTKELQEVRQEKDKLEGLRISYQAKIDSLQKEIKQIKSQAVTEAKEIVSKAHSTVERVVKEIKEQSAQKEIVKTAKTEIKSLSVEMDTLEDTLEVEQTVDSPFAVGQSVRLKRTNSTGEILDVVDKDNFLVLMGDLKVKVHRRELRPAEHKATLKSKPSLKEEKREVKQELDLRGMYGDEAVEAIDKFFDEAILTGLHRVDIIHGKGTGALRKRVAEYLKNDTRVKSSRLGEWNEGGMGVTIVELA